MLERDDGSLIMDIDNPRLEYRGRTVKLTPMMVSAIMVLMALHPGKVTCAELTGEVYRSLRRIPPKNARGCMKVMIHKMRSRALDAGIDIGVESLRGRYGYYRFEGITLGPESNPPERFSRRSLIRLVAEAGSEHG